WDLRFKEARAIARDTASLIAETEGRDAAADYLAAMVAALNDAGAHAYKGPTPLVHEGLAYVGNRRDTTWAILKALDIVDREIADPTGLGIPPDTPERRRVGAILRFHPIGWSWIPWASRGEIMARECFWAQHFGVGDYGRGVLLFREDAAAYERQGRI